MLKTEYPGDTSKATEYDHRGFKRKTSVSVQWIDGDENDVDCVRVGRTLHKASSLTIKNDSEGKRIVGPFGWYLTSDDWE